jgi:hypothetical protein
LVSGNATSTAAFGLLIGTNNSTGHAWLQSQRVDGPATAYNLTLNEAGGNVGIGTASPAYKMQVEGSAPVFAVTHTGGAGSYLQSVAGQGLVGTYTAHPFFLVTQGSTRVTITTTGNVHAASGTTTMTDGFFYIPAAAGAPTGVPTAIAGRVPMYYDTTNNEFYVYNTAWKKVALT